MTSTIEEQIAKERAEEEAAEIKRRRDKIEKAQREVSQRISNAIRAGRKPIRGVITNRSTHAEINDALRRAAGKGS